MKNVGKDKNVIERNIDHYLVDAPEALKKIVKNRMELLDKTSDFIEFVEAVKESIIRSKHYSNHEKVNYLDYLDRIKEQITQSKPNGYIEKFRLFKRERHRRNLYRLKIVVTRKAFSIVSTIEDAAKTIFNPQKSVKGEYKVKSYPPEQIKAAGGVEAFMKSSGITKGYSAPPKIDISEDKWTELLNDIE